MHLMKILMTPIVAACLIGGSPLLAGAQEACDGAVTEFNLNVCAAQEAGLASAKLDSLLAALRPMYPDTDLDEVQEAWVAYRDLQCSWGIAGLGSVSSMAYSLCVAELTWERIQGLKLYLCELGGLSGPCARSREYDLPDLPR